MTLLERAALVAVNKTPLRNRDARKRLVHARRALFESCGSRRYSRPARHGLDALLQNHLLSRGVFVEAGANDGYSTSNTYYLERFCGWDGVLIEGIPALSAECERLRPRSKVVTCALVAPDFPDEHITMTFADVCSIVKGSEPGREEILKTGRDRTYDVEVPARTLSDVLDEAGVDGIDFLSLDVEGFEAPALRGLDLERHRPTWLLIETTHGEGRAGIEAILGDAYRPLGQVTPDDMLYRAVS